MEIDSDNKGKRNRCSSFLPEEKMLIASICARYKNVLENKKTDHVSSEQKNKIWEKVAYEVNASAVSTTFRTPEVLKRFYENRKREVRKIAAEEKKEISATGGGPVPKIKKDPCHEVILSVMNSKTVFGLPNILIDGDTESQVDPSVEKAAVPDSIKGPSLGQSMSDNEIEIVFETNQLSDSEEAFTWKKYIPSNLKRPITTNLVNNTKVGADPEPSTRTATLKRNNDNLDDTDSPKSKRTPLSTSRRRPTTIVKTLARSELAEKYDTLLDKRLELVCQQQKKIEEEIITIRGERELKFELLRLQIAVEKEKLNNSLH